jgi:hypothetical protein
MSTPEHKQVLYIREYRAFIMAAGLIATLVVLFWTGDMVVAVTILVITWLLGYGFSTLQLAVVRVSHLGQRNRRIRQPT